MTRARRNVFNPFLRLVPWGAIETGVTTTFDMVDDEYLPIDQAIVPYSDMDSPAAQNKLIEGSLSHLDNEEEDEGSVGRATASAVVIDLSKVPRERFELRKLIRKGWEVPGSRGNYYLLIGHFFEHGFELTPAHFVGIKGLLSSLLLARLVRSKKTGRFSFAASENGVYLLDLGSIQKTRKFLYTLSRILITNGFIDEDIEVEYYKDLIFSTAQPEDLMDAYITILNRGIFPPQSAEIPGSSILSFAKAVYRELDDKIPDFQPVMSVRRVATADQMRRGDPEGAAQEEGLYNLLDEYGIPRPGKEEGLAGLREALETLKDRLDIRYTHEIPKHSVYTDEDGLRQEGPYNLLRSDSDSPWISADEALDEADIDSTSEFRESVFAELNPTGRKERKPRKARKTRKGRKLHAYHNPLDDSQVANMQGWLKSQSGDEMKPPPPEVSRIYADESGKPTEYAQGAKGWNLMDAVKSFFPTGSQGAPVPITAYGISEKANAFKGPDLISRIAELPVSRSLEDVASAEPEKFWTKPELSDQIAQQAELSVFEAASILEQQRRARRTRKDTTIPASTALCQSIRKRRLSAYSAPPAMLRAGGNKKVVIWLSPSLAERAAPGSFRVMTFRRNTHLDCDLVENAKLGLTPLVLIGKAIQSALYWLAEKPKRMTNTTVYVGRIGVPNLSVAWRQGEPLTLEQVKKNLDLAALPQTTASGPTQIKMTGYNADKDVENFFSAIGVNLSNDVVGPRSAPESEGSSNIPLAEESLDDVFADVFEESVS